MKQNKHRERWGYAATLDDFFREDINSIMGKLAGWSSFSVDLTQEAAWRHQIVVLRRCLTALNAAKGHICFEYDIPRLGRRIDVVLLLGGIVFVIEFKVGSTAFTRDALDQVCDYALDLKNFHKPSHHLPIIPVLVATDAKVARYTTVKMHADKLAEPLCCGAEDLACVIELGLQACADRVDVQAWLQGGYHPTPTIVEAARALYAGHSVSEISRSDAGADNLAVTAARLSELIEATRQRHEKAIFFVTGVPGAGKTLVGLDIANGHTNAKDELYSVYLSGNDPLVKVLHEALARDQVGRAATQGKKLRIGEARSAVKQFIQNVHHFRDDCLADQAAPVEHIALFDEAQRAWDLEQTDKFMRQKKGIVDFNQSEPSFLISCFDRHNDWAAVVCLVGNGQEINTGEAGISAWLLSVREQFPHWHTYYSPRLTRYERSVQEELERLRCGGKLHTEDGLHLSTSMRSFRAEKVSDFVNQLLDLEIVQARYSLTEVLKTFPIYLTRDLASAKRWLKESARGSERYGILVSSQAQRLKPYAIDVRVKVDPVRWFLEGKDDVRSSYYLEDVATEFQVQGLELDWTCVVWDGDLRLNEAAWEHFSFKGKRWERIHKLARQHYLLNAYRVLMTRARQGMVIVVPEGSTTDPTRHADYYNPAYTLLSELGVPTL